MCEETESHACERMQEKLQLETVQESEAKYMKGNYLSRRA